MAEKGGKSSRRGGEGKLDERGRKTKRDETLSVLLGIIVIRCIFVFVKKKEKRAYRLPFTFRIKETRVLVVKTILFFPFLSFIPSTVSFRRLRAHILCLRSN